MTDFVGLVEVPGGRIWAQAKGEGTGVVLVHAGIADARMWDPQRDVLAARHRVVRYDTRGFGRSETADVSFTDRADLIAVMDAAGLDRAVAVGCSRGGSIALDAAIEFPDRFTGLVWVCSGVGGLETTATPLETEMNALDEELYEASDWPAVADLDVARWVDGPGQPAGRAPEAVRAFVRQMDLETLVAEKPGGRPIALDPPAVGRLTEVAVPMIAIVGLLDDSSSVQAAGVLVAAVAGARRIDVPGVAHLPNLERPDWF
ncbi:MAG: alpha/beta fold hydrolase, partial [Chloroflexi bacterium]|nr:alpha/beta fold hydrolase [Chloroflexota bacterium]